MWLLVWHRELRFMPSYGLSAFGSCAIRFMLSWTVRESCWEMIVVQLNDADVSEEVSDLLSRYIHIERVRIELVWNAATCRWTLSRLLDARHGLGT